MSAADAVPDPSLNDGQPSSMKRIVTIIQGVGQLLILALLATSLSGISPPAKPDDPETSVKQMGLNYFQGLKATATHSMSYSFSAYNISYSSTMKANYYFNFQNIGYEVSTSSTETSNGTTIAGKSELYTISMYKPCKLYDTKITTPSSSRRRLEAKDPQEFMMENLGLLRPINRRLVNGTDDAGNDDGSNTEFTEFCTKYASECASKGDASSASFALAFILAFICAIMTFMRIGTDSSVKSWISIFGHVLVMMFASVGVGAFSDGCVKVVLENMQKDMDESNAYTGKWTYTFVNGTVFDVGISAIVFTIVQIVLCIIFRYKAPALADQSKSSGVSAPAPPAATKV